MLLHYKDEALQYLDSSQQKSFKILAEQKNDIESLLSSIIRYKNNCIQLFTFFKSMLIKL